MNTTLTRILIHYIHEHFTTTQSKSVLIKYSHYSVTKWCEEMYINDIMHSRVFCDVL